MGLRPVDVMLVSGKKATSIDELLETIEKYRKGKSLCRGRNERREIHRHEPDHGVVTGNNEDVITTSQIPGHNSSIHTRIPLDDGHFMIETPVSSIIIKWRMCEPERIESCSSTITKSNRLLIN